MIHNTETSEPIFTKIINQINNNSIDLSDPALLYLTTKQSCAYTKATYDNPEYRDNLETPIIELLDRNLDNLTKGTSDKVAFIDLGPGRPIKSIKILNAFIKKSIDITYHAFDVSDYFLNTTEWILLNRFSNINAIRYSIHKVDFNDISYIINQNEINDNFCQDLIYRSRYIFIGLTFCNFEYLHILKILYNICFPNDYVIILIQSLTNNELDVIRPYMANSVKDFSFQVLKEAGFDISYFDYNVGFDKNKSRISLDFITNADTVSQYDKSIFIKKNTQITTAISYRRTIESLKEEINGYFEINYYDLDKETNIYVIKLKRL